jgi:muconolactone delta-isomerase
MVDKEKSNKARKLKKAKELLRSETLNAIMRIHHPKFDGYWSSYSCFDQESYADQRDSMVRRLVEEHKEKLDELKRKYS